MALDPSKWEIQASKNIRYIGPTHGQEGANYVTVLELHRWLQDLGHEGNNDSKKLLGPSWWKFV